MLHCHYEYQMFHQFQKKPRSLLILTKLSLRLSLTFMIFDVANGRIERVKEEKQCQNYSCVWQANISLEQLQPPLSYIFCSIVETRQRKPLTLLTESLALAVVEHFPTDKFSMEKKFLFSDVRSYPIEC